MAFNGALTFIGLLLIADYTPHPEEELQAGEYYLEANSVFYRTNSAIIGVYDVNSQRLLLHGARRYSGSVSAYAIIAANCSGIISTQTPISIIVHYYTASSNNLGLGLASSDTGTTGLFTQVKIWKLS